MSAFEIGGKHAFRKDVPYIVHHPGEGSFIVGPDLILKLDGIREVSKWSSWVPRGHEDEARHYLRIVRKGGERNYECANRVARDWTYQLIVQLIEGAAHDTAADSPEEQR